MGPGALYLRKFSPKSHSGSLHQPPVCCSYNLNAPTLDLIYTLVGNALDVAYEVENLNDGEMYFSIGGHPAFATPLGAGTVASDYYLEFEHKETADRWHVIDEVIGGCTKKYLDDDDKIILNDEVIDGHALIFKGLKSQRVSIKCTKNDRVVEVCYPGFNHWCIQNLVF